MSSRSKKLVMNHEIEGLKTQEIPTIVQKDDFHIAPFHADGFTYGTLTWIWAVSVEGKLFVRAYNGTNSKWYQSAIKQKAGKIKAAGMERKVEFKTINGEINHKIDQAYKEKYGVSPYLNAMISERTKEATIQVLPPT